MADYSSFLDAPDDNRHDAFLDAPATKTETKGHTFRQYKAPEPSSIAKLFLKYAPEWQQEFATKSATGGYLPEVLDVAGGATSTARGALNLISPGAGEHAFPTTGFTTGTDVDKNSLPYVGGQLIDPAAATIGFGAGKAVQAVPAVTRAYKAAEATRAANAARTAGTAATNVPMTAEGVIRSGVAGGTGGAATGYLASEGNTDSTTMGGLFGTGLGMTMPVFGKALQGGAGWLTDWVKNRLGEVKAGNIARSAAGNELPAIRTAMQNAPADLTAGQAAYGINQDPFQALAATAAKNDPASFYRQSMEQQARQREGMLSGVTPDLGIAEANRTGFMASDMANARDAANRARMVREATVMPPKPTVTPTPSNLQPGMTVNVVTPGPTPTMPGIPGVESLKVNPVFQAIITDAKKMAEARTGLPSHLSNLTEAQLDDIKLDPTKSLEGLQMMKAALDSRFSKNPSAESALAKFDDATVTKIKKAMMGAVDTAIPEYSQARANYAANSAPVNQAQLLEILRQRLVNPLNEGAQRAGVFTSALDRGEQSALRAAGLNTRFNDTIENALTPQQFQTVGEINNQLVRDQALKTQAKAGAGALEQIVGEALGRQMKLPGYMAAPVTATNKLIELLTSKVNRQTLEAISKGMQSGKTALEMLDTLPTSEKKKVLMAIGQAGTIAPTAAGTFGAAQIYPKKAE